MDHLRKYRGWLMAATLAVLFLGILVLGMSYASAQTATPAATGTPAGTASPESTGTVEASPVATTTATGSPTAAATRAASPTSAATSAGTTAPTGTATAVGTPCATATVTASLQISLPQQSYLPLDLALQAANAALKECTTGGYRVSVTIVDQSGVEKVVLKGDGAGPHTLGSSFKKAFTAASLGSPTAALVTRVQEAQRFPA